jgi:predicted flap endonuclease-1-like 5' DNA nuclease
MNPLVPILIVVLAVVFFIIWWWNRRGDERPVDEPYHANPYLGTPTYEPAQSAPAPTPSATVPEQDGNGGGAETHEEVATVAASDAAVTVPELVLGDEAAVTTETAVAEKQLHEMAGHTTTQDVPASVPTPVEAVTPVAPVEAAALVESVPTVTPVAPVEPPTAAPADPPAPTAVSEISSAPPPPAAEEPRGDDLIKIEGIGPRISSILQAAGIHTFEQLAAAKPAALKQILTEAKMYTADPATWPQQAKLAAAGKWEQLKTLQDKLDGGRKA